MSVTQRFLSCFLSLLLAAAAFWLPGALYRRLAPQVSLIRPAYTSVCERIPLSGTVTVRDSTDLVCELPLVPSSVLVSTGDTVQVGQVVARISRKQTVNAITALLSAVSDFSALKSQYSFLSKLNSISSIDDLTALIPTALTAPASGTVLSCSLKRNGMLTPGVSCMTIADCSALCAVVSVDEADAAALKTGDTLYLRTAAGEQTYTASISDIAPAASQVLSGSSLKNVVELTADLKNAADLKPGYSVYGYYFSDTPDQYLLIPLDAVYQQEQTEYVYLWQNGKAVRRNITTDGLYAGNAIVTGGLSETDLLILADTEPTPGGWVRVKEKNNA